MMWNVVIATSIFVLHLIFYPFAKDPMSLTVFGDLAQGIALLACGIYFTRAALHAEDNELRFKILIALGFWIWFMGHALLTYSELLLQKAATGTVADAIWLVGYTLILRSIHLMLRQTPPTRSVTRFKILCPAIIGLLVCAILLERLTNTEETPLVRIEQVLFPFLDLWISALAFLLAFHSGRKNWLLAAFGSLIIGIADLIFPFVESITSPIYRYLDIPLFVGYSLWWLQAASFQVTAAKS